MGYVLQEIKSEKYICNKPTDDELSSKEIYKAKIYTDYTLALLHKEAWNRFMNCDFMEVVEVDEHAIQTFWDEHFLALAKNISKNATCNRLEVGCIITSNNEVISKGYNTAPSGKEICKAVGCLINDQERCIRTIHAEQNAILNLPKNEGNLTLYVTHYPCETCAKFIAQCGIKRVVYAKPYKNEYSQYFLEGIEVVHFEGGK